MKKVIFFTLFLSVGHGLMAMQQKIPSEFVYLARDKTNEKKYIITKKLSANKKSCDIYIKCGIYTTTNEDTENYTTLLIKNFGLSLFFNQESIFQSEYQLKGSDKECLEQIIEKLKDCQGPVRINLLGKQYPFGEYHPSEENSHENTTRPLAKMLEEVLFMAGEYCWYDKDCGEYFGEDDLAKELYIGLDGLRKIIKNAPLESKPRPCDAADIFGFWIPLFMASSLFAVKFIAFLCCIAPNLHR